MTAMRSTHEEQQQKNVCHRIKLLCLRGTTQCILTADWR